MTQPSFYTNQLSLTGNIFLMFYCLQLCQMFLLHTQIPLIRSWQVNERHMCVLQQVLFIRIESFFPTSHTKKETFHISFISFLFRGGIQVCLRFYHYIEPLFNISVLNLTANWTENGGNLAHIPVDSAASLSFITHSSNILHSVLGIERKGKWYIDFLSPWSS